MNETYIFTINGINRAEIARMSFYSRLFYIRVSLLVFKRITVQTHGFLLIFTSYVSCQQYQSYEF